MRVVELIIDEAVDTDGIEAISIVEHPAIESDFVALSKEPIELKQMDGERRVLIGAALIPNKMIYRKNDEEEYHIYFSQDTVRKASEMYLQKGRQNNATLEHNIALKGLGLVESWIVDDPKKDKSTLYGMTMPVGTWMVAMKVYDEDLWQEYVKTGQVKGFSIEGYFSEKANLSAIDEEVTAEELALAIYEEIRKGKKSE